MAKIAKIALFDLRVTYCATLSVFSYEKELKKVYSCMVSIDCQRFFPKKQLNYYFLYSSDTVLCLIIEMETFWMENRNGIIIISNLTITIIYFQLKKHRSSNT